MLKHLDSLVVAHRHFARWERVKHRAQTIVTIEFPDKHPLRRTIESIIGDLEECRCKADQCLDDFTKQYGCFRGVINGFVFDSSGELFQNAPDRYWDCPEYMISQGCQRKKIMNLAELACIHILETSGRSYLASVAALGTGTSNAWKLDETTKVFEKDCQRMQKQLKRIQICHKQKVGVLLCLRHVGLPREMSATILKFLL